MTSSSFVSCRRQQHARHVENLVARRAPSPSNTHFDTEEIHILQGTMKICVSVVLAAGVLGGVEASPSIAAARRRTEVYPLPTRTSFTRKPVERAIPVAPETKKTVIPKGKTTVPSQIFNVVKCIVGAGMLALPAGVAAFGDAPSAILPAGALMVVIGAVAAYTFYILGLVCGETRTLTYGQAWSATMGSSTAWMPSMACALVTFSSSLAYSRVLSETVPAILKSTFGVAVSNVQALVATTVVVLLPLCLQKELSRLAPFSMVGVMGSLYTSAVILVRCLDGQYREGGRFYEQLSDQFVPSFGTAGWKAAFSGKIAILVSMLSFAYLSHFGAPSFYWELKDNTKERFRTVVSSSFLIAMFLIGTATLAAFATFGGASDSFILNNYSSADTLVSLSRIAVAASLMFGYPLCFASMKQNLADVVPVPKQTFEKHSTIITVAMLSGITYLALNVKGLDTILSLGGATCGALVVYVFPCLMLLKKSKQFPGHELAAKASIVSGVVLGVVGTWQALQAL